jgi:hypothetical protein
MNKVEAIVTFRYDFTDHIQQVNDERERIGESPMTELEIQDYIEEDLMDFDFRETVGELPLEINIQ